MQKNSETLQSSQVSCDTCNASYAVNHTISLKLCCHVAIILLSECDQTVSLSAAAPSVMQPLFAIFFSPVNIPKGNYLS